MSEGGRHTNTIGLILLGLFVRVFLLFGLVGLPVAIGELLDWWSVAPPYSGMMGIWLLMFGMGLVLMATISLYTLFGLVVLVVGIYVSLILACFGLRPAAKYFYEQCAALGEVFIALGRSMTSMESSFISTLLNGQKAKAS